MRLQYDDCAAELREIRARFGVAVADTGVDLRDDLDGSAALVAALDAVVTPITSVLDLAGGLGVPTLAFAPSVHDYHVQGGGGGGDGGDGGGGPGVDARQQHFYPWYGGAVRVFAQEPPFSGRWARPMRAIAAEVQRMGENRDDEEKLRKGEEK